MEALLISLLTLTSTLIDANLSRIGGHDGVDVYQNKLATISELAAVGELDAPPAAVEAALLDYAGYRRFDAHLAESVVLERHAGEQLVYQHLKLPALKDRDFTLRVIWKDGQADGLSFSIDHARGPAPSKKAVRMTTLTGRWALYPTHGGRGTLAYYHLEMDLSGAVPRWMVTGGAAKDLPNLFVGIRRILAQPRTIGVASRL